MGISCHKSVLRSKYLWLIISSVIENSGPKHRATITILSELGWVAGYALLPLYAYLVRDYVHMNLGLAGVLALLLVWFIWLDESPRWQLATGRIDQAKLTLQKALKMNGKSSESLESDLKDLSDYLMKVTKIICELNSPF